VLQFDHSIKGALTRMQFYFIRHGQSANNLLYATTGSDTGRNSDPELTDVGCQQAALLANYLERETFDLTHIYTSLMVRAVTTGTVVANRLGLELTGWSDLHEEGGIYLSDEQGNRIGQPGKDRSYFETYFPKLILPESLDSNGWWNRPFESFTDRPVRARRFIQDLLTRHGGMDHRVAVVSHGGFYNQFLTMLLNPSSSQPVWFSLNNTAITRIDFHTENIDIVFQNYSGFLPRELIT
jgi:2,3-bisphosphoglycerate-dependent phosphoglycerate mutase